MHKPLRHIEDPVTSIVALLVWVALGFLGLLVLMLTLAIGFQGSACEFDKRTLK